MIKKMLLKFITQFYEIKLSRLNETEYRHNTMQQLLVEVFNRKYGMPKVVENKIYQLLSSCIRFKHIKRIYMFGRFLKLYSELNNHDLDVYLELLKFVKENFAYKESQNDYAEIQFVLYEKAIEFCKLYMSKIHNLDLENLIQSLENFKMTENKLNYIELDKVYEEIIDRICKNRAIRMNFVKCIYEAADLNEDGFLNYQEFELLCRHISTAKLSDSYSRDLFNEFAQTFVTENNESSQALTFDKFSQMTQTYHIFSTENLQAFAKITHQNGPIGNLLEIEKDIDWVIEEFRFRMLKKESWRSDNADLSAILGKLQQKVLNPMNSDSTWISLRLLEEESKLICIEAELANLMPKISIVLPIFNSIEGVS